LTKERPLPNTYWVVPGRILAGEYPGGADPAETRLRLDKLRGAGVDRCIDLTEEGELPPYAHLLPKNIEYLRSAIVDCSVPYNVSQTQSLLSSLRAALAQDRCVYVHCRAGIGRTGVIMGCFLADRESNGRTALKILNRAWRQSERAAIWPQVPQTAEQADYVRHWPRLSQKRETGSRPPVQ